MLAAEAAGDPGVQKLVERFDGQIVRVDRRSSGGPPGDAEGGPGDGTDGG